MTEFTSLNGQLSRLFRIMTAFDLRALFEPLNREGEALNRAGARIWMSADQDTVRLTKAVVLAATELVSAHMSVPSRGLLRRHVVGLLRGKAFGDEAAIAQSTEKLAQARRALVDHTRQDLKLPPVDLFALPEGFDERA